MAVQLSKMLLDRREAETVNPRLQYLIFVAASGFLSGLLVGFIVGKWA